jgi:hypothetical protein
MDAHLTTLNEQNNYLRKEVQGIKLELVKQTNFQRELLIELKKLKKLKNVNSTPTKLIPPKIITPSPPRIATP